jgi:hypothetical protein
MPHNSTLNTASMPTWEGRAVAVDGDGFMTNLAYKVKVVAKTAAYTVTAADSGTIFTTRGATAAVTFTLPTTATTGLIYYFFSVADYAMTVASGTVDTMVTKNDAAADSVAYGTTSEIIGGGFMIVGDGTGWLVFHLSEELATVTVVTN